MAEPLTIWLPGHPPTPNARPTPYERNRAAQQWYGDANLAALAERPYPCLEGVRLEAIFIYKDHRRRDFDNLVASLKPMIDGLVGAGAMVDDTVEVVHGIQVWAKVTRTLSPRTILTVIPDPL